MRDLFNTESSSHALSQEEIATIFLTGKYCTVTAGEAIVTAGDPGDSMFVLTEGEAQVELGADRGVFEYQPGYYFGELSFINPGQVRTATIRAITDCQLVVLNQESLSQLLAERPDLLLTLFRRTCSALVASESALVKDLRERNRSLEQTLDYLRRTREELDNQELLAHTDELTGLYNRRCLNEQLDKFIERASSTGNPLALVLLDLDEFKPVNDTLGHPVGDTVLVDVARLIRSSVRRVDLPCRIGGDEFAVVLVDIDQEQAFRRAETIREAISEGDLPKGHSTIRVTASIGLAPYLPDDSAADLIKRADDQLYIAKDGGRNRTARWSESEP